MRHGMTEKETQTEIIVQIVAGSDTTATAIRSTLRESINTGCTPLVGGSVADFGFVVFLMTCPRAYHQIKQLIKDATESGRASTPITYEEARKLPYLQVGVVQSGMFLSCLLISSPKGPDL